ncbi:unnamed protein product [Rotaria magnacalcarata]|uniref:Peptidase A2 domain-containing protein n=1 Tax=Rotaria magnacalcarata TaxID=392030 RepID=A0A8S2YWY8_9BILA|nr:unnamed protein product [Rotaria magnacalcarata]
MLKPRILVVPKFLRRELPKDGDNSKNIPKNPSKSPLIFITTLVNNYQTKILIDTGATTTFIREDVLQHMTHLQYIRKTPYSFTLADGLAPFHVLGVVEVSIRFGNSTTKVHAHIARKLCATMIIGMNYINKYNLNINIAQQTISIIHNNHVSSMNMDTDFELHRIPANISKPIQIPPRSNRSAQVSIPISSISSPFVPNPFVRNTYALSTPYTFLNFLNYYSDIKLFNMSSHRQYLNEGTCIGFLTYRKKSIIGEKPDSTTHKSFEVAGTSDLRKPAVADSLRMLVSKIDNTQQQEKLYSLLKHFHKTFNTTKHSIAHTRIEHVINTVPHSPPASRPYTQPDKEEAIFHSLMEHTKHDSTRNPYYPTKSRSTTYNTGDRLSDSCNRLLWSPTISDDYSQIADARENNRTTIPILPTQSNHYQRLLSRSKPNCPTHITSKRHTK